MDLRDAINVVLTENASVVKGCAQCHANKAMQALTTSGDGALATPIPLAYTPARHSFVFVNVNSELVFPGDGTRQAQCFFSGDGGATPRLIADIQQGDLLYWVGSVAGYDLTTADFITIFYEVWQ